MPTLKELWEEHQKAEKPLPMVVTQQHYTDEKYTEIFFKTDRFFHGKDHEGTPCKYHETTAWVSYTPPKPKVERWLWVFKRRDAVYQTSRFWMTEDRAKEDPTLVGKDPNCLKPLVTDE